MTQKAPDIAMAPILRWSLVPAAVAVVVVLWLDLGPSAPTSPGGVLGARATAAPVVPDAVKDQMTEAVRLLHEVRDPASAEPVLRTVLESQPVHYGAQYQLALSLDRQGKDEAALEAWRTFRQSALMIDDRENLSTAHERIAAIEARRKAP